MFLVKFKRNKRKLKDKKGVAAVEFSFLVFPLALLTFMMFEVAFLHWGNGLMDNILRQTVTRMKTICPHGNCDVDPMQDIVRFMKEESGGLIDPFAKVEGESRNRLCLTIRAFGRNGLEPGLFNMGGPNDIVLYAANYDWPIYGPASLLADKLRGGDIDCEGISDSECASKKANLPHYFRFPTATLVRNEDNPELPTGGSRNGGAGSTNAENIAFLTDSEDKLCGFSAVIEDIETVGTTLTNGMI